MAKFAVGVLERKERIIIAEGSVRGSIGKLI